MNAVESYLISFLEGQNTFAKNDLRDQNKHFCKFDEHVRLRERNLDSLFHPFKGFSIFSLMLNVSVYQASI